MTLTKAQWRQRQELKWLARGRADAVAALVEHFGWRPSVIGSARRAAGVSYTDLSAAIERRRAYREDVS